MTKAAYLIGEPGVGKTTLMEELSRPYQIGPGEPLEGLLWGETLRVGDNVAGIRLGRSRAQFSGTDALGMAVNPDAIRWIRNGDLPPLILGEGARLGNWKFLSAVFEETDAILIYLRAADAAERRAQRGSNQNEAWIRGRATASLRLFQQVIEAGLPALSLDTTHLTPGEAATIVENEMGKL